GRRAAIAIENSRLYQEEQKAIESKNQALLLLDTFLSTAPIGLAFLDKNLRFVRINKYLAEANGISAEKQIGMAISDVLPKLAPTIEPLLKEVLGTGRPISNHEVLEPHSFP